MFIMFDLSGSFRAQARMDYWTMPLRQLSVTWLVKHDLVDTIRIHRLRRYYFGVAGAPGTAVETNAP